MNLADRLHCPNCKSRLSTSTVAIGSLGAMGPLGEHLFGAPTLARGDAGDILRPRGDAGDILRCTSCSVLVGLRDGIADFVGERAVPLNDPQGFSGEQGAADATASDLLERIRVAAGERWPVSLGEVLELGCGGGRLTQGLATMLGAEVHGLLVADTSIDMLRACRARLDAGGLGQDETVAYVRLSGHEDAVWDAVVDTVAGGAVLARYGDVRALLATVHRVLRPGGRACFVVPNRRYYQALAAAAAAALVRQYARDRAWPEPHEAVLQQLAFLRQQIVHQGDLTFLASLRDKHLFDSEAIEQLGREIGFATVDVIPLDPDPLGGETIQRLCRDAAIPDGFIGELAPLVVSAGAPYFSLLSRQDASASMLLWLTKGVGPCVRTFSTRPNAPAVTLARPDTALGGVAPRWSLELMARETAAGVVVSVGGWCLVNTDVLWVRLRLNGTSRDAAVWRPRPDVHEVLNAHGLYHPLNALCSGLGTELLFDGVQPHDNRCQLQLEVVLANGMTVQGPTPDMLVMNEAIIIAQ